jgi:hypothetical protein
MPDVRIENQSSNKLGNNKNKKKKTKKKSNRGLGAAAGAFGNFGAANALFGAKEQASSLAELIEKQAAAQKRQAVEKGLVDGIASPFQSLQDQLFNAVNAINVAPTPLETLRQMAQSQVSAQFDPQISALVDEMGMRADRGNRSMKDARGMYGALAKDYMAQLPELTQQFAAEDQAANARYDDAQNVLKEQYQDNANEQDAVLKRLGIQAASQDASQQAQEDQAYFQSQMELDQQQNMSALNEQQNADMSYTRNLSNNAKMAGENTAQEIRTALDEFMNQANGQVNSLKAQKGSAIEALLAQMQAQDQQRMETSRQQEFDNMMKLFNFQLQAQNSAAKYAPSDNSMAQQFGAEGTLTTGLAGARNYLASQYPDQPILASNLMEQLNDVLSNKQVTQGKFILEPGDESMGRAPKYSDVGQEFMMDLLRREFEKEGSRYSTGNINATMEALQAYLGKLR